MLGPALLVLALIRPQEAFSSLLNYSEPGACNFGPVLSTEGRLKVALVLTECANVTPTSWTHVSSALWTVQRLNALNFTAPLRLGLSVFQVCSEDGFYDAVFKIFRQDEGYFLGALSTAPVPPKVHQFGELLGVYVGATDRYMAPLAGAVAKLLVALELTDNVTVYSESRGILQEFYRTTREEGVCVKVAVILGKKYSFDAVKPENGTVVVFAGQKGIKNLLTSFSSDKKSDELQMVFAPFDGYEMIDFPEGSYVVQPNFSEIPLDFSNSSKLTPTPLLFSIANPILNLVLNISSFVTENCNETLYKINCLHSKYPKIGQHQRLEFSPSQILSVLKIDAFADAFTYKVFRVENLTLQSEFVNLENQSSKTDIFQSFVNIFTYSMFNETLTNLELTIEGTNETNDTVSKNVCYECTAECINFQPKVSPKTILVSYAFAHFGLRTESWVFAFLAISVLGVIFCLAIFIFLSVRFCKRDILEGNPFLTLLLLLSVILMYCSVVPFCLDSDKELKSSICLARALSTTLTYAFTLSLLLARSILLATISKEVGFMSHVPGPVQSFLTLFIFGVQGALSLQFLGHCEDIFRGISFVYLMSYNAILLLLLVFICPLNTRSRRNYKEGKYFTIAVVLMACTWSCWIPGYAVLEEEWRDPIICLGLVSTASILLGTIFIPRTYMMTIAAARDRLANALPSLPTTNSIVDVYRASSQPVYDCINIAAINAATATIARSGVPPPPPQPEVYSTLAVPYDDEFDFERCITPSPDKVTRF